MIYILRPKKTTLMPTYDVVRGFVVRASSAKEARLLASRQASDEGDVVWLDPKLSTCRQLSRIGTAKILMCDHRAG